ncbi:hypothetical protein ACFQ3J_24115 [Paenibacillus provencensis]|uniref:DUF2975 domain-containing protein n=1 Tax=Paenibacillus provencensis TaxID=441151 RepID=A0ABW3Q260_9BACL|nr:hypothetical protein [Paenibacillus sp. MER 78]MCM3129984.1 hypothetical protein [Paenibacillus sp. MER 78]
MLIISKKNIAFIIFILCFVASLFSLSIVQSDGPLWDIPFILITLVSCGSFLCYSVLEFRELLNDRNEDRIKTFKSGIYYSLIISIIWILLYIPRLQDDLTPEVFDERVMPIDWDSAQLHLLGIILFSMMLLRSIAGVRFLKKLQNDSLDAD